MLSYAKLKLKYTFYSINNQIAVPIPPQNPLGLARGVSDEENPRPQLENSPMFGLLVLSSGKT
jgi:hypothetical protein